MVERNIKKEFTLKNIDSTRNCFFNKKRALSIDE